VQRPEPPAPVPDPPAHEPDDPALEPGRQDKRVIPPLALDHPARGHALDLSSIARNLALVIQIDRPVVVDPFGFEGVGGRVIGTGLAGAPGRNERKTGAFDEPVVVPRAIGEGVSENHGAHSEDYPACRAAGR